jgi:(1->4)-alpha-D-glucan 1-alpha-D-glucosylmutase
VVAAVSEIAPGYTDVWGGYRKLSPATRRALAAALETSGAKAASRAALHVLRTQDFPWRLPTSGPWRVVLESGEAREGAGDELPLLPPGYHRIELGAAGKRQAAAMLIVAPARCFQPGALARGARLWGFSVQLYGLRSGRNWGIGDFSDLRLLVETVAPMGASVIGLNPLHAGYGAEPRHVSPYSPSSRHALNPLYLDVEAIPEFGGCEPARRLVSDEKFQEKLQKLRDTELVDYVGVSAAKREVLELVYAAFRKRKSPQFQAFLAESSEELRRFAVFEALDEALRREGRASGGWQSWPREFRNPRSAAVKDFARRNAPRVEFHAWLQWNARLQLERAQRRARELGMPVGLYCDLALGADGGGAELWADQAAYATGASCGAPPDEFNPRGQDWGLPPYSPRALRATHYQPFIQLLRANMRLGGALRMDHVMALMRLYWIPRGAKPAEGGYVHYPFQELLAILALESQRHRCLVIGEDLGTVPEELRVALNQAGVLSYRPLLFEKNAAGEFRPPQSYPREALVCASTHDLPTLAGFAAGRDISLREAFDLSVDPGKERALREADMAGLTRALEHERLDPLTAHTYLARTPAKLMVVQPEDVFEVGEQSNLPGSVEQHPNWKRKLPVPLESWQADARVQALARAIAAHRPRPLPERPGAPIAPPGCELVATYRVQLNKDFRFVDATRLVPYLAALGVSHLYASPFLKARPGSAHGYDVIDHNAINPEIGTEAELLELIDTLRRHGMGLIIDVVPNHMGVLRGDNAWWQDVLENGKASRYAKYFDIDWQPAKPELRGKVLLAVLGRHYGEALDEGEIRLERERRGGEWSLRYYENRFPLSRASQRSVDPKALKDSLAMHRLLERQHYRLAYWRVAGDEINYRRFFEINELAALRVEERAVFEATHAYIARLAQRPGVDGVRVDHPDGLADPREYLARLAALFHAPYVLVEKIVADHETLAEDWPVHGTTGYRFANILTGLFVDASAEARFDRVYRRFTGERRSYEELAYDSRMLVMHTTLAADLNLLANRLARIAAGNRRTRDYTANGLRQALAEVAAHFPVYRTYVTARGVSATDRRHIDWAVRAAQHASRIADPSVFDFLKSVLTLEAAPPAGPRRQAMLGFISRFQQFTAPVVAKGVEDTAFYRYHRLSALNEVGGEPKRFGMSLKAFHAASEDRARHWPYTMIGTSTHDTKRSEDVRARIVVITEGTGAWRLMLRRWSLLNRSRHAQLQDGPAPSPGDEYLYYQTLLGIWPDRPPDAAALGGLRDRLQAYMLKAVREAKLRTSWINPDAAYEAALKRFVDETLEPRETNLFLKDVNQTLPRVARLGLLVALSMALIKVASPGVPDYYQGTELWDFSLVDPDNRRPVDYGLREKSLKEMERDARPEDLLASLSDGRAKLHVIRRGLEVRRRFPELFHGGAYVPLYADAGREENVCAFALRQNGAAVVAVAPRLFLGLMDEAGDAPLGSRAWGEARLALPEGMNGTLENVLTGETHRIGEGAVPVAGLLGRFPVGLFVHGA